MSSFTAPKGPISVTNDNNRASLLYQFLEKKDFSTFTKKLLGDTEEVPIWNDMKQQFFTRIPHRRDIFRHPKFKSALEVFDNFGYFIFITLAFQPFNSFHKHFDNTMSSLWIRPQIGEFVIPESVLSEESEDDDDDTNMISERTQLIPLMNACPIDIWVKRFSDFIQKDILRLYYLYPDSKWVAALFKRFRLGGIQSSLSMTNEISGLLICFLLTTLLCIFRNTVSEYTFLSLYF